jgi:hypothetical protein
MNTYTKTEVPRVVHVYTDSARRHRLEFARALQKGKVEDAAYNLARFSFWQSRACSLSGKPWRM